MVCMQVGWGDECSVNGGDWERTSFNDGSREVISVFYNPHRKCRPSPSTVARTLEYLEGVPS